MKTMAEVIYKARWVDGIRDGSLCSDEAVADALTAAGFGLVKEAQAGALREAADGAGAKCDCLPGKDPCWCDFGDWLDARAASIEGE